MGFTYDDVVDDVLDFAPPRFTLGGYSMGGRIALGVACAAPGRVARLVLISTTAGIEDEDERLERRLADEQLADAVENGTIEEFADFWTRVPIVATDDPDRRAEILTNTPAGLAASLRGVGAGSMTPLWDRLGELKMPVDVVVGERDTKYREIGERLAAAFPNATLHVLPGGHAVPRDAPDELKAVLARSAS